MITWLKRWLNKPEIQDPHLAKIIEAAKAEIRLTYNIADPKVERIDKSPCAAMRHLPRNGKAWFVVFPYPENLFTISIVEVDDATQSVTRLWQPPR